MKNIQRLIYILIAFLLAGCTLLPTTAAPEQTPAPPVSDPAPVAVIVEGRVVPDEDSYLFFTNAGQVSEVLVQEGDNVAQGEVLARLGNREQVQASLAAAQLELVDAQQALDDLNEKSSLDYHQVLLDKTSAERALTDTQQALDDLDTDDYQDRIDDAEVAVSDAQDALEDAQDEYDKYKNLGEDNDDRKRTETALEEAQAEYDQAVRDRDILLNDLSQARAQVDMATANLEDLQRKLDARKDGPDPDLLALAQARLENAKAQVTAAQAALEDMDLLAPFGGKIVSVDIHAGESVMPNQPVIRMADLSNIYVETNDLTENEVVDIQTGEEVTIIPDVLPELRLTGVVESISDDYIEKAGDITYTTRIRLNDDDPRLRWGMTVEVHFEP